MRSTSLKAYVISVIYWTFPVLSLVSANLGQIQLSASLRLLILSLILSIIVQWLAGLLLRSQTKAILFSCLLAILFASYGQVYLSLVDTIIGGIHIGRHRILIVAFAGLFVVFSWLIIRMKQISGKIVQILLPVGLILLAIPVFQIVRYAFESSANKTQKLSSSQTISALTSVERPDIYLFVLDGYGRSDILKDYFYYDNSRFLDFLTSKGFYVASCSQSNYSNTWFSIGSILNMSYMDAMPALNGERREVIAMVPYIRHSSVRQELEAKGYKTVAFETGFGFTEITDADYYLQPSDAGIFKLLTGRMTPFEYLYLRTTLASPLLDQIGLSADDVEVTAKLDRDDFLYSQLLNTVPEIPGPKFVFAHVMTTHKPFLLIPPASNADPQVASLNAQSRGYRDSLALSDEMLTNIVDKILATAKIPPIIIITGDHGPSIKLPIEKSDLNLYAVYIGGQNPAGLHPTMTPVNSFRIIFDAVFKDNYPLLPDISYKGEDRQKLTILPNACSVGQP